MTKQELMETYTAEQLAEMAVELNEKDEQSQKIYEELQKDYEKIYKSYKEKNENSKEKELQSEVEKYRKAFDDIKKERDCQIAEYQKKIEELTAVRDFIKKDSIFVHQDPIDIAKDLINAEGEYEHNPIAKAFCGTDKGTYHIFDASELRQIAEHLLVYCNHNWEAEE